ncbi:AbrB/MazE/SpoVT family DNA-binding domain-containing protein [Caproiciproducens galactitolivorans]|uniref:AbrB/MazE/SpoVT family DNA-binding domain-containing protein n=1 Tax=Caproiciproducens galactitolivorans TaxID=642589 RepID=A0ABT4BTH5_9FIRM|nr:AbrB/MazE/SpoVT family DNA-binding domain-containing protein [Caproiciproducens galactitolivorans]MCY1713378.1 AbrB/MazE/SpoVT family DNA-binding domain-containing protein [Caproiciproducens galactitolivorans]
MKNFGKIMGFPVKLFDCNLVYIPMEYLKYYGISVEKDRVQIIKSPHSLFYRPILKPTENIDRLKTVSISVGLTTIPAMWIKENHLKKGDALYLLGLEDGFILYKL